MCKTLLKNGIKPPYQAGAEFRIPEPSTGLVVGNIIQWNLPTKVSDVNGHLSNYPLDFEGFLWLPNVGKLHTVPYISWRRFRRAFRLQVIFKPSEGSQKKNSYFP